MKPWKLIAIGVGIVGVAFFSRALVGQQSNGFSANDRNADPQSLPSQITLPLRPETAILPAGTRIDIRLQETISTEKTLPGDHFTASLRGPLIADVKYLAPSRCKIIGQLINVEEPGQVKGSAKLTMVLRKLVVAGKEYDLETEPITLAAHGTKKEEAAVIAGSRATEETIGAITGINDTEKATVIGTESQFTFTLSGPLEMLVIRTMGNTRNWRRSLATR